VQERLSRVRIPCAASATISVYGNFSTRRRNHSKGAVRSPSSPQGVHGNAASELFRHPRTHMLIPYFAICRRNGSEPLRVQGRGVPGEDVGVFRLQEVRQERLRRANVPGRSREHQVEPLHRRQQRSVRLIALALFTGCRRRRTSRASPPPRRAALERMSTWAEAFRLPVRSPGRP